MIEEIKALLGEAAANFTDAQIDICLKMAIAEVEEYCKRDLDYTLELCAQQMAIVKLHRLHTEGLQSMNAGGISENYLDGYPKSIVDVLNRKRKIKVV